MSANTKPAVAKDGCYEVTFTASCTVFVSGAEGSDDAMELAEEEVALRGWDIHDAEVMPLVDDRAIDSSRRHADRRVE